MDREVAFEKIASSLVGEDLSCFEGSRLPSFDVIGNVTTRLLRLLFPRSHRNELVGEGDLRSLVSGHLASVYADLKVEIEAALTVDGALGERPRQERSEEVAMELLRALPSIRDTLEKDAEEVMEHDPAAKSRDEILLAYPGIKALTVHRLAHFVWQQDIPFIPRMMSEMVHSQTGIDIHPGAEIAPYCSIDHGTGLIIGETTVIGEHVSLYQNVTLGAKDVTPEYRGQKRHPTIGSHVVIYAGATVLGDIEVGDNTVIGGNVILFESCPANSRVFNKRPEMVFRKNGKGPKV